MEKTSYLNNVTGVIKILDLSFEDLRARIEKVIANQTIPPKPPLLARILGTSTPADLMIMDEFLVEDAKKAIYNNLLELLSLNTPPKKIVNVQISAHFVHPSAALPIYTQAYEHWRKLKQVLTKKPDKEKIQDSAYAIMYTLDRIATPTYR